MREISESISLDRLLHSDETSRVLDQAQNARRPAQFRLITGAIISTTPAALLRYVQQPKVIACYMILATLFHLGPQGDGQTLFLGGMAAIFYYPALCAICLGVARIAPAHPVPLRNPSQSRLQSSYRPTLTIGRLLPIFSLCPTAARC